ncbi:DUF3108 domain-containing protein [Puniceicoccaceae bacterium K14]|nr:DUF3108 domain-containing protein [Puniceicoccaceae bacterium K14]
MISSFVSYHTPRSKAKKHWFAIALAVAVTLATAFADDSPADFEEDVDKTPATGIDWPEFQFAAADERGSGFRPNETFTYRAQWGIFKKAGVITIATEPTENKQLMVKTTANSKGFIRRLYPLTLEGKTTLDPENWRMVSNYVNGITRKEKSNSSSLFNYQAGIMVHQNEAKPHRSGEKEIPHPIVLDYSAAFLQMRGWDLKIGEQYPLLVSSKGKFYYVELEVKKTEKVKTYKGTTDAFVIEPIKAVPESKLFREGGAFTVWVSNDQERLPLMLEVKTKIGKATLRLESAEVNSGSIEANDAANVANLTR